MSRTICSSAWPVALYCSPAVRRGQDHYAARWPASADAAFLALLAIGSSDLLFAFDSIPAVFGVTEHPYIVFVANAFAVLGLRPLFFLVSGLLDQLVYMSTGLALILAFIGVKLATQFAHRQNHGIAEISTVASIAVIGTVLVATTLASLVKSKRDPSLRAHAGSLRPGHLRETAKKVDRSAARSDLQHHAGDPDSKRDGHDHEVLAQHPERQEPDGERG